MNSKQVVAELVQLGTAQNRKIYARHGGPEPIAGVSFAHLHELRKKLGKTDHALARALLAERLCEARMLGAMLIDPAEATDAEVEGWVEGAFGGLVTGLTASLAAAPRAVEWSRRWMADPREPVRQAGYALLSCMLRDGRDDVDDAWLTRVLTTIERELHASPNDAREAMNGALISIGGYRPALTGAALAAAERIGPVELDHGETDCKTAVATDYIKKMRARADRKAPAKKSKVAKSKVAKSKVAKSKVAKVAKVAKTTARAKTTAKPKASATGKSRGRAGAKKSAAR